MSTNYIEAWRQNCTFSIIQLVSVGGDGAGSEAHAVSLIQPATYDALQHIRCHSMHQHLAAVHKCLASDTRSARVQQGYEEADWLLTLMHT